MMCSVEAPLGWLTTLLVTGSTPEYISKAPRRELKQDPNRPASIPKIRWNLKQFEAASVSGHSRTAESVKTAQKAMPMMPPPRADAIVPSGVTPPLTPGNTLRQVVINLGLANLTDASSVEKP